MTVYKMTVYTGSNACVRPSVGYVCPVPRSIVSSRREPADTIRRGTPHVRPAGGEGARL